jgi:hypothetical protein
MAQCHYCQKYVADNLARCPYCFTLLESAGTAGSATRRGRAGAQRLKSRPSLLIRPRTLLQLPASRLALIGCLGLVGVLLVGAIIFAIVAPQSARALFLGPPTPLPPTPRPTFTPSPAPTPTPEWISYQGLHDSYWLAFPPDWVVLNFADASWKRDFRRLSADYPWLKERISDERLQEEADVGSIWSFDPGRSGDFSIRSRLERSLAGLSVAEIRETVGEQLLQLPAQLGGRIQGGTRTELVEVDGQQAAAFELVVLPGRDSEFDQPVTLQLFALADEKQGYWIEVMYIEQEPGQEDRTITAVLNTFHRLQGSR